jgi:hypothetical protein
MTDRPRDVPADVEASRSASDGDENCAQCGERFDRREWHYPGLDRTDDGDLRIRLFCSEHCRARWEYLTRSTADTTDP